MAAPLIPLMLAGAGLLLMSQGKRGGVSRRYSQEDSVIDPDVYAKTLQEWDSLQQRFSLRGATYIARIPGNGVRDPKHKHGSRSTLIYIPPTFSSGKPYELIYFFHGLNGYLKKDRVGMSLQAMEAQDRNFILVVPELPWSHNATPFKRQREVFTGSGDEDFQRLYGEVTKVLRSYGISKKPAKITFVGHSAGGSALRAIAAAGAMDKVKPNVMVWSDSTYTTWLDETWKDYQNRNRSKFVIFNMHDSDPKKPFKQTERFLASLGSVPSNVEVRRFNYGEGWTHTKVGDNALPMSFQA